MNASLEYQSGRVKHPRGTRWVSFDWRDKMPTECEAPIYTVDSYTNDPKRAEPLYWLGQVLE